MDGLEDRLVHLWNIGLGNTVTFEEMQAIEFTVIAFHTHTMRIIEMLLDLQVNEKGRNCFIWTN